MFLLGPKRPAKNLGSKKFLTRSDLILKLQDELKKNIPRISMKFTEMGWLWVENSAYKILGPYLKGGWSCGTSKFWDFWKKAFIKEMITFRPRSSTPFSGRGTKFYMVGFQLRVNHLREFHKNPSSVFFFDPFYNFRVKSARVKIIFLTQNVLGVSFNPGRNVLTGFPRKTTEKIFLPI